MVARATTRPENAIRSERLALSPPCAQMKVVALLFTILAVATGFATPPKDDPPIPGRTTYSGGMCDPACAAGEACFFGTCHSANLGNTNTGGFSYSSQAGNAGGLLTGGGNNQAGNGGGLVFMPSTPLTPIGGSSNAFGDGSNCAGQSCSSDADCTCGGCLIFSDQSSGTCFSSGTRI